MGTSNDGNLLHLNSRCLCNIFYSKVQTKSISRKYCTNFLKEHRVISRYGRDGNRLKFESKFCWNIERVDGVIQKIFPDVSLSNVSVLNGQEFLSKILIFDSHMGAVTDQNYLNYLIEKPDWLKYENGVLSGIYKSIYGVQFVDVRVEYAILRPQGNEEVVISKRFYLTIQ